VIGNLVMVEDCDRKQLKDNCLLCLKGDLTLFCLTEPSEPVYALPIDEIDHILDFISQFIFITPVSSYSNGPFSPSYFDFYDEKLWDWQISSDFSLDPGMHEVSAPCTKEYASDILHRDFDGPDGPPTPLDLKLCEPDIYHEGLEKRLYSITSIDKHSRELLGEGLDAEKHLYIFAPQAMRELKVAFGPPSSNVLKNKKHAVNTPEFAAVMEIWEKYWAADNGNTKSAAIVAELQEQGFTEIRAKAIEMICRPQKYRTGGRTKK